MEEAFAAGLGLIFATVVAVALGGAFAAWAVWAMFAAVSGGGRGAGSHHWVGGGSR